MKKNEYKKAIFAFYVNEFVMMFKTRHIFYNQKNVPNEKCI